MLMRKKKVEMYRGFKISVVGINTPEQTFYIHWSKNSLSAANTIEDARWIIDQELQEDDE